MWRPVALVVALVAAPSLSSAAAISPACQASLDAHCNADASCVNSIKAANASLPLYALYGGDETHSGDAWRCYSGDALNANHTAYVRGAAYCTRPELAGLAAECGSPAANATVLFAAGWRGVRCYRIPVLLRVGNSSRVLAFAEARIYSCNDRGPKHVAMRASDDGGLSWGAVQFILSDPSTDPTYDGLNLGAATYDAARGLVLLHYLTAGHSLPVARTFVMASKDGGASWGASTNLTDVLVAAGIHEFSPGPGTGVQLSTGALVVPGWYKDARGGLGSLTVLSHDGAAWTVGGRVPSSGADVVPNECDVAVLPGDRLVLGMRNGGGRSNPCHCRLLSFSSDGGASWTPAAAAPALVDPVCQGATLATGSVLWTTNADNATLRVNGTLHRSDDGGRTWAVVTVVDPGPFGYSDVAPLSALGAVTRLGVVWEHDTAANFTLLFTTVTVSV